MSIDQVRTAITERFSNRDVGIYAWVREMFTDRAILELDDGKLFEVDWSLDDDELTLGEAREVSIEYVAKAEGGPRLAGPIVRKDAAKRIAYSAVLVPGEPDSDEEVLTAAKVEEVAHTWLEQFRAFDVQHSVKQIEAVPVESYIEPADRTVQIDGEDVVLPAGTWTVAVKFADEDAWDEVSTGKRTGLSIMGVPNDQLEAALAAVKSGSAPALKRVTLADVGGGDANGDWFAPFIGVVDQPAVPKAKFYAFKAAPAAAPKPGLARRLADAITGVSAPKEGRRFSDQTYRRLKEVEEAVSALVVEADQERQPRADKTVHDPHKEVPVTPEQIAEVAGAVKSALGLNDDETIDTKIAAALAAKAEGEGEGAAKNEGGDGDEGGEDVVFSDAQLAQIKALIDPVAEKADRAEKRTRPGSLQADDDDVVPAFKSHPDRDAFGRRVDA